MAAVQITTHHSPAEDEWRVLVHDLQSLPLVLFVEVCSCSKDSVKDGAHSELETDTETWSCRTGLCRIDGWIEQRERSNHLPLRCHWVLP